MKKTPIHWDALESALERNAPEADSFLDLTTGQVVSIVPGDPEASFHRAQVTANLGGFARIEPVSSREQYRWMERFVLSVSDGVLRERLVMSIDGKGAFRRFKDVLAGFPVDRERWFDYRLGLLRWHLEAWLRERKIEPESAAPWGVAELPPELPEVAPSPIVLGAIAPGEAFRRHARELVDTMAAIDLPAAIAFLEFLKERGTALVSLRAAAPALATTPETPQPIEVDRSDRPDRPDCSARRDDESRAPRLPAAPAVLAEP